MPISLLTSAPTPITPSDHAQLTSSTPSSFADIPPVCYRKEERVKVKIEPGVEGWAEGEEEGTLFVATDALGFWSPARGKGLSIPWPLISLHAISRTSSSSSAAPLPDGEGSAAPATNGHAVAEPTKPCIYCQLDEGLEGDAAGDDDKGEDKDWGETRELFIVPADPASLDDLFAAFSQCAAAFPTDTSPEDGLDDGAIFADADGEAAEGEGEGEDLSEAGRVRADFSTPSSRYAPY